MSPDMRTALLIGGLVFVGAFLAMTIVVALDTGVDVLTIAALGIIWMLGAALIGALRNPPE
jgi:hypothetical protein